MFHYKNLEKQKVTSSLNIFVSISTHTTVPTEIVSTEPMIQFALGSIEIRCTWTDKTKNSGVCVVARAMVLTRLQYITWGWGDVTIHTHGCCIGTCRWNKGTRWLGNYLEYRRRVLLIGTEERTQFSSPVFSSISQTAYTPIGYDVLIASVIADSSVDWVSVDELFSEKQ